VLNKFKYIINTVKKKGASHLKNEVIKRVSQLVSGNKLSNIFTNICQFKLPDGSNTPLYAGYREYIQPNHFLSHANHNEVNTYLSENIEDFINGSLYGTDIFYSQIIKNYDIEIKNKKILEIGSHDSTLSYFLALKGAKEVHSTDIDFDFINKHNNHFEKIKEKLFRNNKLSEKEIQEIEKKINIYYLDIQNPDINDKFDIILSKTVLEHIYDLRSGISGMNGLLKQGGLMIHQFNPFFSETGGHEFCILDFPWGHVRLSENEFENYLSIYRNWEKEKALDFYRKSFNNPKLNLDEIDKCFESNKLKISVASEKRRFKWKPDEPISVIYEQAKRNFPNVTIKDLYSDYVLRVIKK
jgi:SAM-dependent methyltransferase